MTSFAFCPVCARRLTTLTDGPDRGRLGCAEGHFVHYDNPALTAMAFIACEGRYLVLRRAQEPYAGAWDLPGGFVESGETPQEAVEREIADETGLQVAELRIIGAYTSRYGDGGKWTVDVAFEGRAAGTDVRLSEEKSEAAWVELSEMPELAFAGERSALDLLRTEAAAAGRDSRRARRIAAPSNGGWQTAAWDVRPEDRGA